VTLSDADLSRAVSHALRHEPWLYELELDEAGWVPVQSLVEALRVERGWSSLTVADVEAMVAGASKQRHEIRDGRIRALYGHSLPGRIDRVPAAPPVELFHGTSPAAAEAIRVDGLHPMGRQFVHLSVDRDTARAVGARKAPEPVILAVAAREAAEVGVAFYVGNEKVWLADSVPARFVEVDR
jgi:putative RNA 2'-phosphotransferase